MSLLITSYILFKKLKKPNTFSIFIKSRFFIVKLFVIPKITFIKNNFRFNLFIIYKLEI